MVLDGIEVHLTAKEFELLYYLAEDPGAVFQRREILRAVWDGDWYGTTKTWMPMWRRSGRNSVIRSWIEAVRGVGFRLGIPG